ncbi:MAG: protein kinase [Myxococcaceae bacterium]
MSLDGWPVALDARFTPHRLVGRGNFGAVFEATDVGRGARVAVKVLRADRQASLAAFKREFRALADLAHDNLVALHELGRARDDSFLVMELVDGAELLASLASQPLEAVRSTFAQVALGLGFLHAAGRLHRDLKPANVRVTPQGRAVVLDFGLAVVGRATGDEGLVGSAAYLAPELASGGEASPASDLYALGVMLCEVLTGQRPFVGSGLEVLALKRAKEAEVSFSAGVPDDVAGLVRRLLRRAPSERPDVREVVRVLDAAREPLLELQPDVPLVGRDDVLTALDAEVRRDGPTAVWLSGPPGLGKSAVLRHFVARWEREAAVFSSTCFEHETTPFRAIDGLVDGLARWLAREATLPPELATHAANLARSFPALRTLRCLAGATSSASLVEAHRHEAALALKALLAHVATRQRVVVVIDDLHWADADSVPFLTELLEAAPRAPMCFVGALRDEGHPLLVPLRRTSPSPPGERVGVRGDAGRLELRLSPLDTDGSRTLVRAWAASAADVDAVLAAAQGNPFLLQALAGHGGKLESAVTARVARVPAGAKRLLEAVCLVGAPLVRGAWGPAGALDLDEALALGHLRAGRLVRVRTDGALEPYHDTLRRAVVDGLPADARRERHEGLVRALEAVRAEPELLAEHLFGAGRSAEAAERAVEGAQRADAALAFHHAAKLYARALEWMPRHPQRRAREVALGRALSNAGRGGEAADAFLRARELSGDAPSALELEREAAAQLLRTGHVDRGLSLTRQVLQAHGLRLTDTPRGAIASIVWSRLQVALRSWRFERREASQVDAAELARIDALTSASIGLAAVDSMRATELMARALVLALKTGEPRRLAICLGFETAFSGNAGGAGWERTQRVQELALSLAGSLHDDYALACARGGAGIAAFHFGSLARSLEHLDHASALFMGCVGAVKELFTLQLFALAGLAQQGQLAELGRRLGDHLRLAVERGDRYAEANLRSGLPNLAWLGVDDEARARHELELARPGLVTTGYSVQHFFELLGRFQLELYAGRGAVANEVLAAGLPPLERSLLRRTEWIAIAIDWMKGRAALATRSTRGVEAAARRIEARRRPWGNVLATSLRAGALAIDGDRARARAQLDAAATLAEGCELRLHATTARFAAAQLSGEPVDEHLATAQRLGALRVDKMLRLFTPGAVN